MADSVQYKSLPEILYCKTCNYYTCNKKQIEKHFISSKHIKNSSISTDLPIAPAPAPPTDTLSSHSEIPLAPPNTPNAIICECCGKTYKSKATFTRHQRNIQEQNQQNQQNQQQQTIHDQENIDNSLELITDDDDDDDDDIGSSNIEVDYMSFNPLIINHDVMYFMHAFMYSTNFIMMMYIYFNKICSFFSLKSDDDSD